MANEKVLSIIIPAHNEQENIPQVLDELRRELRDEHQIPYEVIVVDDCSTDETSRAVEREMEEDASVRLFRRRLPSGFGRAVRDGLALVRGEVVIIFMADCSDNPVDVVTYYRKIVEEGFDCVFGSRFRQGSEVKNYPRMKLVVNRLVNRCIMWLFWTRFNDLTNAFKAYRTEVIDTCGPYCASHFNLTLEMSLAALVRRYNIAEVPIRWQGRTWGCSNLRMREMGRRYLSTLLMLFFQRVLVADDLLAERLAVSSRRTRDGGHVHSRLASLEQEFARLRSGIEELDEDEEIAVRRLPR